MVDGPTSQDNNRVTMAELKKDVCHVLKEIVEMRDETRAWRNKTEQRVHMLEERCQGMQTDLARLDERQKATTGILGIFTIIASTIAGAIGTVVK